MNINLLELHREQLCLAYYRISTIKLSDNRLNEVRNAIGAICSCMIKVDFEIEDPSELYAYRNAISLLQEWIGLIANQEHGTKPHTVINCLYFAAAEWIPDSWQFIFVATDGAFAIYADHPSTELVLEWIYEKFNVLIQYKLVHIQIPFHLDNDYIFNVCLYHELGHFIDNQLRVTDGIAEDIAIDWMKRNTSYAIAEDALWDNDIQMMQRQINELFADVFAAQYVGKSIIDYLAFFCEERMNEYDRSHASAMMRIAMMQDLINNSNTNEILNALNDALKTICNKTLLRRYGQSAPILTKNNYIFEPIENLHLAFESAWSTYYHHSETIGDIASESYMKTCRATESAINDSLKYHYDNH